MLILFAQAKSVFRFLLLGILYAYHNEVNKNEYSLLN